MTAVTTDWTEEAVRLRREKQMATKDIAARVDRSESQVRKVLAAANAARHVGSASNGNGSHGDARERVEQAVAVLPGQTTVDEQLADVPPEDDPEYEATDPLDQFRAEAGEAVGPMPPSRAVDPQDGFFDKVWEDADLEAALEAREQTREVKLTASKAHKLKDDEVKGMLAGYSLAVGEVARVGRFRIKKTKTEGSEVSFTTEPREQLRISVGGGE